MMQVERAGEEVAASDHNACAMALERCLKVGMEVFLDASPGNPNSKRFSARLRGWELGHYILVGLPQGTVVSSARPGKACVIRFMHEGEVWGFSAVFAEQGMNAGFPLIQMYWPREVARVQVRKHERVAIQTPCTIELTDGQRISATIGDLSGGGCSLHAGSEFDVGATLYLTFRMPDGGQVNRRPVIVRNRRPAPGQGVKYGCQFQAAEEKDHGIQLFVARKIAIDRGESAPHPQVLVLSRNEQDVELAQQALGGSRYEVIEAAGILDLGHRLHSCEAVAILISFEQRELSAIEVLRLIRQSPGMDTIPLFIYGGGAELQDQALKMGATLCLNDLSETQRILPYLPQSATPKAPESEGDAPVGSSAEVPEYGDEDGSTYSSDARQAGEDDEILLEDPS